MINIAGSTVLYNDKFKIYLISSLPNPHYTPDILTKVTLLNFSITDKAATDQMLEILIKEVALFIL